MTRKQKAAYYLEQNAKIVVTGIMNGTIVNSNELIDGIVKLLAIPVVVQQSELLACDCDRQPLRYNEFGICKYCGKQKPSEG